ncbi:hypothetical protein D3C72_1440740 [compost metagenome]
MSNFGDCGNIDQTHIRVGRRFAIHHAGPGADRRRQTLRAGQVYVSDFHTVARQSVMKITEGAAVNRLVNDQLVARIEQCPAAGGNRAHTGGKRHRSFAPLQIGYPLFQQVEGRVGDA